MKCVVVGQRIKVVCKAVRLLSKYAERVTIVANASSVVFQAVNDSKSAFTEVEFKKDFFAEYSTAGGPFECKVDIKSLVLVFRIIILGIIWFWLIYFTF